MVSNFGHTKLLDIFPQQSNQINTSSSLEIVKAHITFHLMYLGCEFSQEIM
jgi:hypothetical protein